MLSNYHPHHESYGSSMVQSLILENDKLLDLHIEKYVLLEFKNAVEYYKTFRRNSQSKIDVTIH